MVQEQWTSSSLKEGAASAIAFLAAVSAVGILDQFGWSNAICLALISTLIAAGALEVLRIPVPLEAHLARLEDWRRHGVDFAVAAIGVWGVGKVFPMGTHFLCEPLVPWRLSIALFGAFSMTWLGQAVAIRAATQHVWLLILLAFFWIAPFYGFFYAPWFLALTIASPCADRPLIQSLIAAVGMLIAAEMGRRLADWLFLSKG